MDICTHVSYTELSHFLFYQVKLFSSTKNLTYIGRCIFSGFRLIIIIFLGRISYLKIYIYKSFIFYRVNK